VFDRWVGYTGEDYTGWQYLLEEGEYSDCADLGGADHPLLLSFRFLQAVSYRVLMIWLFTV
jgi:hypothetical protein